MIRKNIKKVTHIATSDWHLRENVPVAYVRDFEMDQWEAVDFIANLQEKYDCPVLHAGDLFHHWKPSPYLLSKTIQHLPKKFYSIYGNHDLPQHNLDLLDKCGIYTLIQSGKIKTHLNDFVEFCHFGTEPTDSNYEILLWHVFTYQGKEPWPGCVSPTGKKLLKKHPNYDLIITGDNHQTFVEEYNGRVLINPGSLMRQTAAQIDFHPSIFLIYEDLSYSQVFLPWYENAISREHLDKVNAREERLSAFIDRLNDDWQAELSFEENLKAFENANNISPKIIELIYKAIEL